MSVCVCLHACILLEVRGAAKWFSLQGRKVNVKVWRMGLSWTSSWISMLHLYPSVVLTFTSKITSILLSPPTGKEQSSRELSEPSTTAVLHSNSMTLKVTLKNGRHLCVVVHNLSLKHANPPAQPFQVGVFILSNKLMQINCGANKLSWRAVCKQMAHSSVFASSQCFRLKPHQSTKWLILPPFILDEKWVICCTKLCSSGKQSLESGDIQMSWAGTT